MPYSVAAFANPNARLEPGLEKWLDINTQYAQVWPNITVKREPPRDADEWKGKPDKANLFRQILAGMIESWTACLEGTGKIAHSAERDTLESVASRQRIGP